MHLCFQTCLVSLKENDQKQLSRNQNETVSKTKLFDANFMQIRL